ncbi:MAG: tRNA pseudouridine(13) synthase TruD [Phycisphaeraceae bacterium]
MSSITSLTYLTHDLPGVGGRIKVRDEDFLVEEQPAYPFTGEGEHLIAFIEKTQIATTEVARRLARDFRVTRNDVGYAGLKDKHAIARQHFSIRLTDAGETPDAAIAHVNEHPRINVLWVDRHRNKLRRGHLAGNRFVIRIRDVEPTAVIAAKPILDRLVARGVPNYVGEQRFGYRDNNHVLGRHLLRGEHQALLDEMLGRPTAEESTAMQAARSAYDRGDYAAALDQWPRELHYERHVLDALRQGRSAERAVTAIDLTQREFLVSALQSAMFNRVLDRRLQAGMFDRLLAGDLAYKHDSGAVFRVDAADVEADNAPDGRAARLAVSPTGPMWGHEMMRAEGEPGAIEQAVLGEFDLAEDDLRAVPKRIAPTGTRRPLRIGLRDADIAGGVDEHGAYIRLAFELPRGAFATVVLREIMKTPDADADVTA